MPPCEEYFGSASELKPDELPTIRDIICYAKFLRDNNQGKNIGVAHPDIDKVILWFLRLKDDHFLYLLQ